MSVPRPHSPPRLEGSSEPRNSISGVPESGFEGPSNRTSALREFSATLKRPADLKCFRQVGRDGICRIIRWVPGPDDEPTAMEVYDAQPMSPEVLKEYLDRREWSQKTEDIFRGVDGRNTPKQQWFNPLPGVLPPPSTKNERIADRDQFNEEQRIRAEKIAKGELKAEDPGPACGVVRSNYDLRPR